MKADKLLPTYPNPNTGIYAWNIDVKCPELGSEWCFYDDFKLRITPREGKTVLELYNPTWSALEYIELSPHSPQKYPLPIEAAHCLIDLFANAGDHSFYGNLHILLEEGELLEMPTGARMQKLSKLYVNLISQYEDRSDFRLLEGLK